VLVPSWENLKFSLYFSCSCIPINPKLSCVNKIFHFPKSFIRDAGTGGGGRRGSRPRCPLPGGQGGQRCPFNLQDCLGEIANCQKCCFRNARNAVTELQEYRKPPTISPALPYIILSDFWWAYTRGGAYIRGGGG
jgi:hypothetical protein